MNQISKRWDKFYYMNHNCAVKNIVIDEKFISRLILNPWAALNKDDLVLTTKLITLLLLPERTLINL